MHKKRNDFLLIGILGGIIFIGLILFFVKTQKKEELVVKIYHENELVQVVDIHEEKEIIIHEVTIVIEEKKVYVKESSCRDHVCMNQGKIHLSGQTITCLPQRVFIRIEGKGVDVGI